MKKFIVGLIGLSLIAGFSHQAFSYDQVFPSVKLRYGSVNYFTDTVINNGSQPIGISFNPADGASISFTESEDHNQNGADDGNTMYEYATEIFNNPDNPNDDYIVPGKSERKAVILENPYSITKIPSERKINNIEIVYSMVYWNFDGTNWIKATDPHTEYQPYEITWCGDGVRDDYMSQQTGNQITEQCDPNDSTESGWGDLGCKDMTYGTQQCTPLESVCGDGIIGNGQGSSFNSDGENEQCDDGNNIDTDMCTNTCQINNIVPGITIDKVDANPLLDLDNVVGNDTQTISSGSTAIFKIRVENTGTDDLTNIMLSDPVEPNCGGSLNLPNFPSTFLNGTISGEGDHTDNIFQVGEIIEYSCESTKSDEDYTNTVTVNAVGIVSGSNTSDTDSTQVVVQNNNPIINIVKTDNNTDDLDLDIGGNDSQTIISGSSAGFTVVVTNIGSENLNNVVITDLEAPFCSRTIGETETLITNSVSGNGDAIFDVGETFTYTCSDINVTSSYTNIIEVEGVGVDSNTTVNDNDTSEVVIFVPNTDIDIDKVDANINDLDGQIGTNDSQTVSNGSGAVFSITVTNTGLNSIENLVIEDPLVSACSRTNAQLSIIIPTIGNNDLFFNPGESFNYICNDSSVSADYENVIRVDGTIVGSGNPVFDIDESQVVLDINSPTIDIVKTDNNTDDLDLDIGGNDSQTIISGSSAGFLITVQNNGSEDLNNVVITDPLVAACSRTSTDTASLILTATGSNGDTTFDIGESFSYSCIDTVVTTGYTNIASVSGSGVTSGVGVFDTDSTDITIFTPSTDIDIQKIDNNPVGDLDLVAGNDTQTLNNGSGAVFNITVTNIGSNSLENLVISDPLVAACSRTNVQLVPLIQAQGNFDTLLDPTETFTYPCTDTVVTADYTNTARVDATIVGSGNPVFDSDTSEVVISIPGPPVCTALTVSQSSGTSPYTSNYNCTASGPSTFQVKLTNPAGVEVFNGTGSTGTFNINLLGTYTASCFINSAVTTTPACTANLTHTSGGNPGGGGTPNCLEGVFSESSAICTGGSRVNFIKYTCQNGVVLTEDVSSLGSLAKTHTFNLSECNIGLDPLVDPSSSFASMMNFRNAQCETSANGTTYFTRKVCQFTPGVCSGPSCGGCSGPSCGTGGPSCGDGAVQTWRGEECDSTLGCDSNCKLDITTYPRNGSLDIFGFHGTVLIGDKMDPYDIHNLPTPKLKNTSTNIDHDLVLDKFCSYQRPANDSLDGPMEYCVDIPGGILYPGETVELTGLTGKYSGNISGMSSSQKEDNNDIVYTVVEDDGNYSLDSFFNEDVTVRVVKPTITTTGGGTNLVNNSNISNLNTAGNGVVNSDENKNFVGGSLGSDGSSFSKDDIDKTDAVNESGDIESSADKKLTSTATSDWINYKGMENVYYITGPYTMPSDFDINKNPINGNTDTKAKTYIIDGNYRITKNITGYGNNVAFIVKGNLTIENSVDELEGTYIVLKNSSGTGGKIYGGISTTNDQIIIKGAVYGDTEHLISKRTYIKNNNNGQIDVGTIISFGSSVFRKPAPLSATFIKEYTESTKIAQ